jgi:integrase
MSREELGWLLAALPDEHRLFFEFLSHTGLRISETAGLRWEHVDLTPRRLRVREQVYRGKRKKLKSKTGKRDLPLSPVMADRLLAHRARIYEGEKASVFPSEGKLRKTKDGFAFPFDSKALAREVLIPTRGALGMDWVTFHTFRHTCASLLFAEGRNIRQFRTGSVTQIPPSRCAPTSICLIQEWVTLTFSTPRLPPRARPGQRAVRKRPQPVRPSKPRIWQPRAKMPTTRKQP